MAVLSAMSFNVIPAFAGTSGPPDPVVPSIGCQEKKPGFFRALFKGKNKSRNEVRGDGNVSSVNINGDGNVVTVNQNFVKKTTVITPTVERVAARPATIKKPVVTNPVYVHPHCKEVVPSAPEADPCPPSYAPYVPKDTPCPPSYAPYVPKQVPCPPQIEYVYVQSPPPPPQIRYVQAPQQAPCPPEIRYVQTQRRQTPQSHRQVYQPRPGCTPGFTTRRYDNGRVEIIPDSPGYGRNQYFASRY